MINSPITPSNFVDDPKYQREMDLKKPAARIRMEDKWIKDLSERGSIGVLFEIQGLESKLENMRVMERERTVVRNRGETSRNPTKIQTVIRKEFSGTNRCIDDTEKKQEEKKEKDEESNTAKESSIVLCDSHKRKERRNEGTIQVGVGGRPYLRAHQLSGPPLNVEEYPNIKRLDLNDPQTVRVSVPTARSAMTVKVKRNNIDFIKANAFALDCGWYKRHLHKSEGDTQTNVDIHGHRDNKNGVNGDNKNGVNGDNKNGVNVVKGRMMSSVEQREMMSRLLRDRNHWFEELSRLPISMETQRVRARQREIETRIDEIEGAMEVFGGGRRVCVED